MWMNHSPSPYVIVASLPVECFLISTCGEAAAGPAACAVPAPVKAHATATVIARGRKAPARERVLEGGAILFGIIQPACGPVNWPGLLVAINQRCYDGPDDGASGLLSHRRQRLPLPRLLRSSRSLHLDGASDECRLRVHNDAAEDHSRAPPRVPGGRVRREGAHPPAREVQGVQGTPAADAGRAVAADPLHPSG